MKRRSFIQLTSVATAAALGASDTEAQTPPSLPERQAAPLPELGAESGGK
jgi:hypothetical protein